MSRSICAWVLLLGAGLLLTHSGVSTWDSYEHLVRTDWLLSRFGLPTDGLESGINPILAAYGPLWSLVLGLLALPFRFLHDPIWIQDALNFTLFPATLGFVYVFLRNEGYAPSTRALAVAALFSIIRWGGHSLSNVTDFPLACVFLVSALLTWRLTVRPPGKRRRRDFALATLAAIAAFLIRPPMLLPLAALSGATLFLVRGLSIRKRIAAVAAAWFSLVALSWAMWPYLWDLGFEGFAHAGSLFAHFPISYPVRLYGADAVSDHLPFYYSLIWLPLIVTPAGLAAILAGLWGHARSRPRIDGLPAWLAANSAVAYVALLVLRPSLYDEERHVLFLFPPLVLAAALGWDALSKKWRWAGAAVCAATAIASYATWGRYSYVYRDPAVGPTTSQDFMGDYWGACVSPAAKAALAATPAAGGLLVVPGPALNARLQLSRFPDGGRLLVGSRSPGPPTEAQPLLVLATNRLGGHDVVLHDIERGLADRIDVQTMPGGEVACVVARYPATKR